MASRGGYERLPVEEQTMADEQFARAVEEEVNRQLSQRYIREQHRLARQNMQEDLNEMRDSSPAYVGCYLFMAVAELIATIIILGMYWAMPCDKPLRWFIAIYTARVLLMVPLTLARYNGLRAGLREETEPIRALLGCFYVIWFVWFIFGNIWLFSSDTCATTAPVIYKYTFILLIIVYVSIFLPCILALAVLICFPCVMFALQLMPQQSNGATEDQINALPTKTWEKEAVGGADAPMCAVCMNEYQFGEELRTLPCKHEFHSKCIDQWLKVKRTCPLCRKDIATGKEVKDEEPQGDEAV